MSMTINADRKVLIAKLTSNRVQHVAEFDEAMHGWRDKITTRFEDTAQQAREGKLITLPDNLYRLQAPVSYEKDYTCAINMLEMHVSDIVELSTRDFQRFVQDDWDWKDQFSTLNASYSR